MPAIALHVEDEARPIGFVLVAGADSLATGSVVRDCVILATPTDAALLDHPLIVAIEPWLNDERIANVVVSVDRITVHVKLQMEDRLIVELDAAGTGTWRLDPDAAATGWCQLAPA